MQHHSHALLSSEGSEIEVEMEGCMNKWMDVQVNDWERKVPSVLRYLWAHTNVTFPCGIRVFEQLVLKLKSVNQYQETKRQHRRPFKW